MGRKIVKCAKCKKDFPLGQEIEEDQEGWICPGCAPKGISLELLDFIHERIALTRTEDENHGRFILRELVQNADDAGANIIALRFEPESLLVANDGRAFTANAGGDFDRISRILRRHQAEDKETTGHFGSGFQTVYAVTNKPEVHSGGRSGIMNPVKKEWDYLKSDDSSRIVSPYVWKDESRGVIFRFPWRDDRLAKERFGDDTPFEDRNDWPRWGRDEQKKMYDDLKDYAHQLILCCNHISIIRLIWIGDKCEAYQAVRDFRLASFDSKPRVVGVSEGVAKIPKDWFTYENRERNTDARSWKCFQIDDWKWGEGATEFRYLLVKGLVKDSGGKAQHVGKLPDGRVVITPDSSELKELKKNIIHILFPLFDAQVRPGKAFLYSTIPLPRRSENWFVFTGHFFPEEGRKDVAISSLDGKTGEWYRLIVRSVGNLYLKTFESFVEEVQAIKNLDEGEKQKIILNSTPAIDLAQWMRPGKEQAGQWANDVHNVITRSLLKLKVLWTGHEWVKPEDAIWPRHGDSIDEEGATVLEILGQPYITKEFIDHPCVKASFREKLFNRELKDDALNRLFFQFSATNVGDDDYLHYGQKLPNGLSLGQDQIESLIEYCIKRKDSSESVRGLPIVPGADRVLRPLSSYKILSKEFEPLRDLMTDSFIVHPDFEDELEKYDHDKRSMKPDDVLTMMSRMATEDPKRFDNLSPKDHKAISKILKALENHEDFSLRQSYMSQKFIPVEYEDCIYLSSPNSSLDDSRKRTLFIETRPEDHEREFIFSALGSSFPGLTEKVRRKIRFLSLQGLENEGIKRIAKKLNLIELQPDNIPTNFIRHFLSDRYGSLFRDEVLSKFLGITDDTVLSREKKEFLAAIKAYYRHDRLETIKGTELKGRTEKWLSPEEMGEIPLLYDKDGNWSEAKSYAIEMGQEIEKLLGYRTMHKDFQSWHKDTLCAIGVSVRPGSGRIIEVIEKISEKPEKNRANLADIIALVLTSVTPFEDNLRQLQNLQLIQWVPTINGSFSELGDVLLPTKEIIEIVGEEYPTFFDVDACSENFRLKLEKALSDNQLHMEVGNRLREIGFADQPNIRIIDRYISEIAEDGKKPPAKIFESASKFVLGTSEISKEDGWYYAENKWWKGHEILISSDETFSKTFGSVYLLVHPLNKGNEIPYLKHIGAREMPTNQELFDLLMQFSKEFLDGDNTNNMGIRAIWKSIGESHDVPAESSKEQLERIVFAVGTEFIRLSHIIIGKEQEKGIFRSTGQFGDMHVVLDLSDGERDALSRMGVKDENSLGEIEILDAIESVARIQKDHIDTEIAGTIVRLLRRLSSMTLTQRINTKKIWPIVKSGTILLSTSEECYIKDRPEAAKFEGVLNFLYDISDGESQKEVRSFAASAGHIPNFSDRFKETLVKAGERKDPDGTDRLHLIAEGLKNAFPDEYKSNPDSVCWLERVMMYRVESLVLELKGDGIGKPLREITCSFDSESHTKIFRLEGHPTLYYDLTQLILDECIVKGFIGSKSELEEGDRGGRIEKELETKLYYMLTRPPSEWIHFINGYISSERELPSIMETDEEIRPGWFDLKEKLKDMYGFCQICGRRTPSDESTGGTCERIHSIVALRGGRYKGDFERYELKNSLFLCPNHHTLYDRHLIRFPDLEDRSLSNKKKTEGLSRMANEWSSGDKLGIEVFEATDKNKDPKWIRYPLSVKENHATLILKWLSDWIANSEEH